MHYAGSHETMNLSPTDIHNVVGIFLWPFLRIGAAVGVAPIFGARTVPVRVRLALALTLTTIVVPLVPSVPAAEILGADGLLIASQQILIGLSMGFVLLVVFVAFVLGGQVVAMQMGLGFASLVDPQNGVQTPMVSQFYVLLATLIFLALDGHLTLIQVLVDSFRTMPIGTAGIGTDGLWQVVIWGREIFAGAVMIALPSIVTLLLVNLAFGVLTRSAPQLNIFAVGFPVIIVSGYVVIMATLWTSLPRLTGFVERSLMLLTNLMIGG